MSLLRSGDPAILRILLDQYLIPLHRYAERILDGASDSEEAVQEAFIRLWERRESWREDGSVKSLLYTLTRNAAIDYRRRRRRELALSEERISILPSNLPTPLDDAQESEFRYAAEDAVSGLPPRRQEIFRLVREGGLTYKEVSRVLDISPQTVANLMSLALSNLRAALGPLMAEGTDSDDPEEETTRPKEASGSD